MSEILQRWMNRWRDPLTAAVRPSSPPTVALLLLCTLRNGRRFVGTRAEAKANRISRGLRLTWVPSKESCNRSSGSPRQRVCIHLHHAPPFFKMCVYFLQRGDRPQQVGCVCFSVYYLSGWNAFNETPCLFILMKRSPFVFWTRCTYFFKSQITNYITIPPHSTAGSLSTSCLTTRRRKKDS